MRITDYWSGNHAVREQLCDFFTHLGFNVKLDTSASQLPNACWAVAARATADLKLASEANGD